MSNNPKKKVYMELASLSLRISRASRNSRIHSYASIWLSGTHSLVEHHLPLHQGCRGTFQGVHRQHAEGRSLDFDYSRHRPKRLPSLNLKTGLSPKQTRNRNAVLPRSSSMVSTPHADSVAPLSTITLPGAKLFLALPSSQERTQEPAITMLQCISLPFGRPWDSLSSSHLCFDHLCLAVRDNYRNDALAVREQCMVRLGIWLV